MTEKPIAAIEQLLERTPLLWHHCPDGRGCHGRPGLPDFIIVGPRGIAFREGKPPGQHPRGGQVDWRYAIVANGLSYGVWTTREEAGGLVAAELEALL
jgi:hypothetical protein